MTDPNDFYEDDEPVGHVLAAFESGEKGVTARPAGQTVNLVVPTAALVGEVGTLRAEVARLTKERDEARQLARNVDALGTAFIWRPQGGNELVLDPVEVTVVIAVDRLASWEILETERDKALTDLAALHAEAARLAADRDRAHRLIDELTGERDEARRAGRRLTSALIAVSPKLETPYTDMPELTPWSRFVAPALKRLRTALAMDPAVDQMAAHDAARPTRGLSPQVPISTGGPQTDGSAVDQMAPSGPLGERQGDERGEVVGTDTVEAQSLTRPFTYREPANLVTLHVNSQGPDGLAFVAIPAREAYMPYEQYGVVLPRDLARNLALRMLATLGPDTSVEAQEGPSALDDAMASVWLHGNWRWLTRNMTTEEKTAAADAVDRHYMAIEDDDEIAASRVERWWLDV